MRKSLEIKFKPQKGHQSIVLISNKLLSMRAVNCKKRERFNFLMMKDRI